MALMNNEMTMLIPSTSATVDSDGAAVVETSALGATVLCLSVENTGDANALTDCIVSKKAHPDGDFAQIIGGTDWADAANIHSIKFCSTATPHNLAASGTSYFEVWIDGAVEVQVVLKSTSGTTATVSGNLSKY